jgi:hypothetical protein
MRGCLQQQEGHKYCGTRNNTSLVPTRLVDVGEVGDLLVRLVEVNNCANGQDFTYLILSYCWGAGNENSKTTRSNLEGCVRGFVLSDLPKTIQDAILLTRMMGYRYLWVDAICIIQGQRGDFQSESPKMGDYYSNAACCISAAVANDSSEGFLTPRPLARYPIENFAVRLANHSPDDPGYTIFKPNDKSLRRCLLESPLSTRGWCLQETALPKRILHCTLQGLYLECPSFIFLEGAKVPWDGDYRGLRYSPRVILSFPDDEVLFSHGWYSLVSLFSRTDLTYEIDFIAYAYLLRTLIIYIIALKQNRNIES